MNLGFGDYFQFVFALIFVLALIAVLTLVARRLGLGYGISRRGKQQRRLSVVEIIPIDAKRRLALVRRDSVEHLVLLGAGPDLLIESGIPAPAENFGAALARTSSSAGGPEKPR